MNEVIQLNRAEKKVYTVSEIAKILSIGRNRVYSLIRENHFKSLKIGTSIRVPIKSFNEWLENQ